MKRSIVGYLSSVATVTALALAYWVGAETVAPGQQYADPWLPCLYIGSVGGPILWLAVAYAGVVREFITSRKRKGST